MSDIQMPNRSRLPALRALVALLTVACLVPAARADSIDVDGDAVDVSVIPQLDKDGRDIRSLLPELVKVTDVRKLDKHVTQDEIDAVKKIARKLVTARAPADDAMAKRLRQLANSIGSAEKSLRAAGEAVEKKIDELNSHPGTANDYTAHQLTGKRLDIDDAVGELVKLRDTVNKKLKP